MCVTLFCAQRKALLSLTGKVTKRVQTTRNEAITSRVDRE
jgi:hypothetical protein